MGAATAVLIATGYLMGSIPTGVVVSRLFGSKDIRSQGSGNIGATNVYRVLGMKPGVLTLLGDMLKGVLPVLAARTFVGDEASVAWVAFFTFCGHLYPVFLAFRGGKGVATALGIFVVIAPVPLFCATLLFLVMVWKWKYVSLGSITAALTMPILLYLASYATAFIVLSMIIACLIVYRHKDNIKRLSAGSEPTIRRSGGGA